MSSSPSEWRCTWRTGPDAGGGITLAPGRSVVGRAAGADVRCDDPSLLPHHAVLDVRPDGVWITQLTGRVPVRVSGAAIDGPTPVAPGSRIELGASELSLDRLPEVPHATTPPADGVVRRGPRAVPTWQPAELSPPAEPAAGPAPSGGLVPAIAGLAGAALVAVLMHQPMFLLFGMLGATVAVASWVAQRVAARRRRRREATAHAEALEAFTVALAHDRGAFVRWHAARVPTVVTARAAAAGETALWDRRPHHADAFTVSVGDGQVAWRVPPGDQRHHADEPLTVPAMAVDTSLGDGARLALQGPQAMVVARALLAQLVTSCGPADLRVVVVTEHPDRWACVTALPHLRLPDGSAAVVGRDALADTLAQLDDERRGHLLLVTDDAEALGTRTSPLRRALHGDRRALLAVLPHHETAPQLCTALLATTHGPVARWVPDTTATLLPVPVRVAGMGEQATFHLTAALAPLRDPEDALDDATRLPHDVALAELVTPGEDAVLQRWSAHTDPAPCTPVGVAADGVVDLDLVRDGPHALVAGTTGSGKSELLRSLVVGLAAHAAPEHLTFVLVDYKGGATFDGCRDLPHVVGVVTDLDDQLADRALRSLHAELRRREEVLRDHGAADLTTLRSRAPRVTLPRLVVVIDEFAALVAEQPEFLQSLVGVAQRGRSLGVHLVLATQRPHGVISDEIRANTNLRVALRLHDVADAVDVVGDPAPALLPRRVPGRAVLRMGADEHVTFQTARVDEATLTGIRAAAARRRVDVPAPWTAPLPAVLSRTSAGPGALGTVDDPDRQRQLPLRWAPADGSVVVAGSRGSGVSSTLHTLATSVAGDPGARVYVLLAGEEARLSALADHPRCVVVDVTDRERTARLLRRVRHEHDDGPLLLVVDDLAAVRRALDGIDTQAELDHLDHLLGHDPRRHAVVLVGCDRPSAVPAAVLARCAHRWVLHLHDPHDAGVMGVAGRQVPGPVPGRAFLAEAGRTAQLVEPGGTPLYDASVPRLAPIDATPALVVTAGGHGRHVDGGAWLPVGPSLHHDGAAQLEVPDGEHVLVLGGARSGRSTALARLAVAWREAHPDGRVLAVLPRRSSFPNTLADVVAVSADVVAVDRGRWLVVVDDADLVDDPSGALAALAAGRHADRTVLASGRPDALRQAYGHWTAVVRRSRLGLVAAGGGELDGDLLGAVLPRRLPVAPRPGLMWVVQQGTVELAQVAVDGTVTADGHDQRPVDHIARPVAH